MKSDMKIMTHLTKFCSILMIAGLLACSPADAKVLATVNGKDITKEQVKEIYDALPKENRPKFDQASPGILNSLVEQTLLDQAVSKAGIAKEKNVKRNLEAIRGRLLREEYLRRKLEGKVTDSKVKSRYEKLRKDFDGQEEVKARHILVKTEDKAKKMIEKLKNGANFADLAKKESTGPSAKSGGDLGFFVRGNMVPEFANAAFNLKKGEYTKAPVQTRFGWHVIKVEDRRTAKAPEFDKVKENIRRSLRDESFAKVIGELRKTAKIELKEKK